jgi:hypothetical protein
MALEAAADGPTDFQKRPPKQQRLGIRARHVVYLQLFALLPSVLVGRCEEWGCPSLLHAAIVGTGSVIVIFWTAFLFPFAILALLANDHPPERWSWAAARLSFAMSFASLLAVLPLVQSLNN